MASGSNALVLEIDCTVEDTPQWRRLIANFELLTPGEQIWALKEAEKTAKRSFLATAPNSTEARALFEQARDWSLGSRKRRMRLAVELGLRWARRPFASAGRRRWAHFRDVQQRLSASELRLDAWKSWLIVKAVGLPAMDAILAGVDRGLEAQELERAVRRASAWSKARRRAARVVFFPVYAVAWAVGAARAQWRDGLGAGASRFSAPPSGEGSGSNAHKGAPKGIGSPRRL